jgi:hypothetical protein
MQFTSVESGHCCSVSRSEFWTPEAGIPCVADVGNYLALASGRAGEVVFSARAPSGNETKINSANFAQTARMAVQSVVSGNAGKFTTV